MWKGKTKHSSNTLVNKESARCLISADGETQQLVSSSAASLLAPGPSVVCAIFHLPLILHSSSLYLLLPQSSTSGLTLHPFVLKPHWIPCSSGGLERMHSELLCVLSLSADAHFCFLLRHPSKSAPGTSSVRNPNDKALSSYLKATLENNGRDALVSGEMEQTFTRNHI